MPLLTALRTACFTDPPLADGRILLHHLKKQFDQL